MDLLILLLIIYLLDSSKFKILIKFYKQKGSFVIKKYKLLFLFIEMNVFYEYHLGRIT